MLIKSGFSRLIPKHEKINTSRIKKGERGIWQRRYWEHLIRNEDDYEKHVNYIHHNPVKHGYVNKAIDWPYSTIHEYITKGVISPDWGHQDENIKDMMFGEVV
jgi:putative transposase